MDTAAELARSCWRSLVRRAPSRRTRFCGGCPLAHGEADDNHRLAVLVRLDADLDRRPAADVGGSRATRSICRITAAPWASEWRSRIPTGSRLSSSRMLRRTTKVWGQSHRWRLHRAKAQLRKKIDIRVAGAGMKAFPFCDRKCDLVASAVLERIRAACPEQRAP